MHGLDPQASRTVQYRVDDHARIAARWLKARDIARDIAGSELQGVTDPPHIAFDRQPAGAGQIGEIIQSGARDLHHALRNMMFVASARTALIYMPVLLVLLVLFTALHLSRRTMPALFAAAIIAAAIVWSTSPYLRQRIADVATEYRGYESNSAVSTAQRLYYWRKSIGFVADAPLFGHGTGSIRQLFAHEAVGQSGLAAEVVSDPHNQSLNVAVQWGLLGGIVLYGMWLSHLLLFRGEGLAAWIGLVTVVQNFVSSLLNSHLFDFHEGWMYVLGVGVAGGMSLRATIRRRSSDDSRVPNAVSLPGR